MREVATSKRNSTYTNEKSTTEISIVDFLSPFTLKFIQEHNSSRKYSYLYVELVIIPSRVLLSTYVPPKKCTLYEKKISLLRNPMYPFAPY